MRISITADERALALFALELADHECEATRKGLERLRLEPMTVMALQASAGELRRALQDTKRRVYDWTFDDRRALATGLHVYREQLDKLATREGKLIVETRATEERITDVRAFLARLAGQESLFPAHEERTTDVEQPVEVARAADTEPSHEARVVAEHTPRNPIDFECAHCNSRVGVPCKSQDGKIVAALPHVPRLKAAHMYDTPAQIEIANRLYTDAVLWTVFGRVDDELRAVATKYRSIDPEARWVQTLRAGADGPGALAEARA